MSGAQRKHQIKLQNPVIERSLKKATKNYKIRSLSGVEMKGYTYILKCSDNSYYTGSTKYLEIRLEQHQNGEGANHTKKRRPVELVYFEEHERIDTAFYREKQIQGWSRKKKEALILGMTEKLVELARCMNETSYVHFDSAHFDSGH